MTVLERGHTHIAIGPDMFRGETPAFLGDLPGADGSASPLDPGYGGLLHRKDGVPTCVDSSCISSSGAHMGTWNRMKEDSNEDGVFPLFPRPLLTFYGADRLLMSHPTVTTYQAVSEHGCCTIGTFAEIMQLEVTSHTASLYISRSARTLGVKTDMMNAVAYALSAWRVRFRLETPCSRLLIQDTI